MRWQTLFCIALSLLTPVKAIFADDAFHIDYHHALLGLPQSHATFFHQPQSSSNASLLYAVSDKAVLGAINPRDGNVLWRQQLSEQMVENGTNTFLVAGDRDGQIISAYGSNVVCWDALDGKLIWAKSLGEQGSTSGEIIYGLQTIPVLGSSSDGATQDVLVLSVLEKDPSHVTLHRLAGDGGGVRWQYTDTSAGVGTSLSIAASAEHAYYISKSHGLLASSKAKVVVLDIASGREVRHNNVAVDAVALGHDGQYAASCPRFPFLISSEKPFKTLKFNLLESSKVSTLTLDDKGEDVESLSVHYACRPDATPSFLIHVKTKTRQWAEVFHVNAKGADAIKAYTLPATQESSTFTASSVGSIIYFIRTTESEVSVYSSESHGRLGRWPRKGGVSGSIGASTKISHATAEVVSGRTGLAVRVAETSASGDWSLIRNGEMVWTRPESLAYTAIAAWADDIDQDTLAGELEVEGSVNPVTAYAHRLNRHLNDLMSLPEYLSDLPKTLLKPSSDEAGLSVRQKLVGTKTVLVGTTRKELLALDVGSAGAIRWHTDLSSVISADTEYNALLVSGGRASIYTTDGSLTVVNTTNGELIEHQQGTVSLTKLVVLPGQPSANVVKVDVEGKPHIATDFQPPTALEGNTIVTLTKTGNVIGWAVGQSIQRTWTLRSQNGAKFVEVIARPTHDPVASIGKVLGDRSVLYKYLSPNLALLKAVSDTEITMYLVDAVTGAILHTSTHTGVLPGSFHPAVMSENWFAYSITKQDPATSALSTQLIISELYESSTPNDRGALSVLTNYSSFSADVGAKPHVISQAYIISEPISHLAVTQTAQGITTRQLLATLPNSNAIAAIPREVLNARRPVGRDPTSLELEEGLFRYAPVLELEPKGFLTHSREVMGIKKLLTSPTLLESTSMVFGFGHDIFGTQVAPSMAFDVLGKQFNKLQLMLTVVGLGLGVLAVRPIVKKRMVEGRWKN